MLSKKYIAQISDTHLFGDKNTKINSANSYANFKNILNSFSLIQKPDLIVVSGDLSQDCTFESYQHLANLLNKINIKYYLLPGNHDDVNILNKVFDFNWHKGEVDYSFEFYDWFIYVIDTARYPDDSGTLSDSQLSKLEKSLSENKSKPTIIFMHHHPVKVNSSWMDEMILKEHSDFNKIIKENLQIKAVLFGHIHQVFEAKVNGTFYASAPATCYQVLPNTERFTMDKLIPGYRLIELTGSQFSSRIIWVE